MISPSDTLMRMALRLCERGDAEGAAEALRGVLAMRAAPTPTTTPPGPQAETFKAFAARIGATPRHVRNLDARGRIVCIGEGRGRRVLVAESVTLLRESGRKRDRDSASAAGEEWARRRSRLRVVDGTGGG